MKANGEDDLRALARMDDVPRALLEEDPEVLSPASANLAALAVDWMGFKDLIRRPEYLDRLHELPKPQDGETADHYIRRIWPLLDMEERGAALDLGLQRMVTMRRLAETGIQVRVWRAHQSGEWVYSPSCPDSFAEWVKVTLLDMHSSRTEASYLYRLCGIVHWLADNPIPGIELPDDLESCFRRPDYRRWRAMVGKLAARIQAIEEGPIEEVREIEEEIVEIIQAIQDEDTGTEDLDNLGTRRTISIPPIVMEQTAHNPSTGLVTVTARVSEAQLIAMRQKLGNLLDLRLEGEEYSTEDYDLVEYRIEGLDFGTVEVRRVWSDTESAWSNWEPANGQFQSNGSQLNSALYDPQLNLAYMRYWEKRDGD